MHPVVADNLKVEAWEKLPGGCEVFGHIRCARDGRPRERPRLLCGAAREPVGRAARVHCLEPPVDAVTPWEGLDPPAL